MAFLATVRRYRSPAFRLITGIGNATTAIDNNRIDDNHFVCACVCVFSSPRFWRCRRCHAEHPHTHIHTQAARIVVFVVVVMVNNCFYSWFRNRFSHWLYRVWAMGLSGMCYAKYCNFLYTQDIYKWIASQIRCVCVYVHMAVTLDVEDIAQSWSNKAQSVCVCVCISCRLLLCALKAQHTSITFSFSYEFDSVSTKTDYIHEHKLQYLSARYFVFDAGTDSKL